MGTATTPGPVGEDGVVHLARPGHGLGRSRDHAAGDEPNAGRNECEGASHGGPSRVNVLRSLFLGPLSTRVDQLGQPGRRILVADVSPRRTPPPRCTGDSPPPEGRTVAPMLEERYLAQPANARCGAVLAEYLLIAGFTSESLQMLRVGDLLELVILDVQLAARPDQDGAR